MDETIKSEKACGSGIALLVAELEHMWESLGKKDVVEVSNMAFWLAWMKGTKTMVSAFRDGKARASVYDSFSVKYK